MLQPRFKGPPLVVYAIAAAGLALFVFMVTPAGVERDAPDAPIRIHFADNISPAHRQVIQRFNELHRGRLEVVPVDLPFTKFSTNERKELLTRTLRSKTNRIDVFAVDLFWIPRFAKWSEPLENDFTPAERAEILPHALESCFHEDRLVAIPLYLDIGMMYYRRDLLQRLPASAGLEQKLKASLTWEELIALKQSRPEWDQRFYIFAADNYEGLMCSFIETLAGQDLQLFSRQGLNLRTREAEKGLQLLVDLVHRYHLAPVQVTEFKENDCYRYALQHDALFFRGWPGNLRTFDGEFSEKIRHVEIAALPHFAGHAPKAVFGGWNLMISKYSSHKAAALQFVKFLMSRESQEIMYEQMGFLPPTRQIYEDAQFLGKHPEMQYYRRLYDMGFHRPASAEYTQVSDIVSYYARLAIRNEITVSAALARATAMAAAPQLLVH